jgi:metal-responsive CopG/Arc/MetJ family transcriptional regulator
LRGTHDIFIQIDSKITRKELQMATITIAEELLHQAKAVAANAGYPTPDSLIEDAIRQMLKKMTAAESQRLTQNIRDRMEQKGISEEAILTDFERFRQVPSKETAQ